jgi:hypothetical protein
VPVVMNADALYLSRLVGHYPISCNDGDEIESVLN